MIKQIKKLRDYHKYELLTQSQTILDGWNEQGNPQIVNNVCELNNEDKSYLVLYRCDCGEYIADYEDYSGRDLDADRCPHCNKHYDYTEKELNEL